MIDQWFLSPRERGFFVPKESPRGLPKWLFSAKLKGAVER